MERMRFTEFKKRISWGSIFAGVITVLAISVLLSILGSSISLYMLDPTSSEPVSGIGTTIGIWTVISLLISLTAGGFVAGKLAGLDGIIHGFLVWATTLIVAVILAVFLAVSAVKLTANILGSVSSVAGNVISGVGSAVGSGVSELASQAQDVFGDLDLDTDMDRDELRQDVRDALRRSGVREFQPEFLQGQLDAVKSDLSKSVRRLITNPNDADVIIDRFLTRLKTRTETAFQDVNRDDVNRAIANNSNMTRAEVDRTVDEYVTFFNRANERAKERIENLESTIEQAKQDWDEMKQNALEQADKATNSAATTGLISFFAILIGGGICTAGGFFGARRTREGYEV